MKSSRINASTTLAGLELSNPLINGAYIGSKSLADIKRLASSSAGAIVVGSISVKPRKKNPGQGYWRHKEGFYSLNSFGMPNGGLPYFEKHLPEMVKIAHAHNKPLIANVVGFSDAEFVALVQFAQTTGADMVELNLGCPNVWDHGSQKKIISYHPELVRKTLRAIAKSKPTIKIAVKISPLPPDLLQEVTQVITESGIVHVVTAVNSYPNGAITTGTRTKKADSGTLAGLTGRALKPIGLGVVQQLRALLPSEIEIIGCGGISSKNDVLDYLNAGAKAVQLASVLKDSGLPIFDTILD